MRLARAQVDAQLAPFVGAGSAVALRYREVDSWRKLAGGANLVVPVGARPPVEPSTADVEAPIAAEDRG